jgi:hypothetical protein
MPIESQYWKEELARIAKSIRPVSTPRRWSERAACTVERDVMIGFFIVRRMIELHKVSSRVSRMQLDVFSAPATRDVTKVTRFSVERNYNWRAERAEQKAVGYICNQCIHAYLSFVDRGPDRNWSDLLVVSDFDRNDVIWRVPFKTIRSLFETAANDWPSSLSMTYDAKARDFDVTTD